MKSKRHVKTADAGRSRGIEGDRGDNERVGVASQGMERVRAVSKSTPQTQQPIRLAGANCLSLDAWLNGSSTDGLTLLDTLTQRDADLSPVLSIKELAQSAELSTIEKRAIVHIRRGIPAYKLAKKLGCRPCHAKRALESALKKIHALKADAGRFVDYTPIPSSIRLTYREKNVRNRPFTLTPLSEHFREIMAQELFSLISQRDPSSYEKSRVFLDARIGRHTLLFTTEIMEQEVRLELLNPELVNLTDWRSRESLEDLARDRIRARNRREAETRERERIHALNGELGQEEKSLCDRRGVLLEALPAAVKKRDRLGKQLSQPQSAAEKKRIKDQKDEAEEQIDRIERELGEISWRLPVIREEQASRGRETARPEFRSRITSKKSRSTATAFVEVFENCLEPLTRDPSVLTTTDVFDVARIQHAIAVVKGVLDLAEKVEKETKS